MVVTSVAPGNLSARIAGFPDNVLITLKRRGRAVLTDD